MNKFEFDVCIPATHPALPGHFPGHPIVPGVLLLDEVMAATLQLSGQEIIGLQQVKFLSPLLPDERAQVMCEMDSDHAVFLISLQRDGQNVVLAKGKMLTRLQNNESLD